MQSKCVRCGNEFLQNINPVAHHFSICQDCHKESPETIYDQNKYDLRRWKCLYGIK